MTYGCDPVAWEGEAPGIGAAPKAGLADAEVTATGAGLAVALSPMSGAELPILLIRSSTRSLCRRLRR